MSRARIQWAPYLQHMHIALSGIWLLSTLPLHDTLVGVTVNSSLVLSCIYMGGGDLLSTLSLFIRGMGSGQSYHLIAYAQTVPVLSSSTFGEAPNCVSIVTVKIQQIGDGDILNCCATSAGTATPATSGCTTSGTLGSVSVVRHPVRTEPAKWGGHLID